MSSPPTKTSEFAILVTRAELQEMFDAMFRAKIESVVRPLIESVVNERLEVELKRLARGRQHVMTPSPQHKRAGGPAFHSFGNESYNHMLMPYLSNVIVNGGDLNAVVQKLVVDLYFNPDVKRNNNVYIPNDSYNCINIWSGGMWKSMPLESTLEKMVTRANDVLQHYMVGSEDADELAFKQEIGKKRYDALREFTDRIDNIEDYPEFRRRLLKDTEHTILTNQHIVHAATLAGVIEDTVNLAV